MIQNNINENNSNNNNQPTNTNLPSNVVWNRNLTNTINENTNNTVQNTTTVEENSGQQPIQRTEPIVINTSLNIDIEYYLWIKDNQQNIRSQKFKIMKGELTRK